MSAALVPEPNGPCPLHANTSTAPKLKMSLAGPASWPRTCSGDKNPDDKTSGDKDPDDKTSGDKDPGDKDPGGKDPDEPKPASASPPDAAALQIAMSVSRGPSLASRT